jgi:hypothetical protein
MKRSLGPQWKKLLSELDLAQQAFNVSHARLTQSLRASEAGVRPPYPLSQSLRQHFTAASCLLAMGRATINFRKRHVLAGAERRGMTRLNASGTARADRRTGFDRAAVTA